MAVSTTMSSGHKHFLVSVMLCGHTELRFIVPTVSCLSVTNADVL